jgi:hypothetical protein
VEVTGTIQSADGSIDHITAHGEDYEAAIPEGTKLITIRTDS